MNIFFLLLNNSKGLNRTEISRKLNTPRTTIFDNIRKLQKQKYVKNYTKNTGKKGQPTKYWFIPKWLSHKFSKINTPIVKGMILDDTL